ncbi:DNA (cytosine-5)-methyltransferase 1B [Tetrabaena socialis]|uniref:DNA (cytosine-5-)-methyltransferase n=1 Tax=Tetrabaena socialis TaxID=47790 RepID=A0A2J8A5V6_9CHLO|nr:DNA (cytosine-5)-methyltransferase 1B [Tetrabaena socialis]|eukprot:PNH07911.1 DNA (cytosine-5)-methyltransferase 1B [Tetrabaena socialis]
MEPPKWLRHCGAATPQLNWKRSIKVDGTRSPRGKPLPLQSWAEMNGSQLVCTRSGPDKGTRLERTAASQPQGQQKLKKARRSKASQENDAAAEAAAAESSAAELTEPKGAQPEASAGLLPLKVLFEDTPGILVANKLNWRLSITCCCKTCVDAEPEEDKRRRMGPAEWQKHCGAATPPPAWKTSIKVDGAVSSSSGTPLSLQSWAKANSSEFVYTQKGTDRGTRLVPSSQPLGQQVHRLWSTFLQHGRPQNAEASTPSSPSSSDAEMPPSAGSASEAIGGASSSDGGSASKSSRSGSRARGSGRGTGSNGGSPAEGADEEAGPLWLAPGAHTIRVVPGSIVRRRGRSQQLGMVQHIAKEASYGASAASLHAGWSLQVVPVVRGCDTVLGDASDAAQLFLLDTSSAPPPELLGGEGGGVGGSGGGGSGGHVVSAAPSGKVKARETPESLRGAAELARGYREVWAMEEVVEVLQVDLSALYGHWSALDAASKGSPPAQLAMPSSTSSSVSPSSSAAAAAASSFLASSTSSTSSSAAAAALGRFVYVPHQGMFRSIRAGELDDPPELELLLRSGDGERQRAKASAACQAPAVLLPGGGGFTKGDVTYRAGDFVYLHLADLLHAAEQAEEAAEATEEASGAKKGGRRRSRAVVPKDEPWQVVQLLAVEGGGKGAVEVQVRRFFRPESVSPDIAYSADYWDLYAPPPLEAPAAAGLAAAPEAESYGVAAAAAAEPAAAPEAASYGVAAAAAAEPAAAPEAASYGVAAAAAAEPAAAPEAASDGAPAAAVAEPAAALGAASDGAPAAAAAAEPAGEDTEAASVAASDDDAVVPDGKSTAAAPEATSGDASAQEPTTAVEAASYEASAAAATAAAEPQEALADVAEDAAGSAAAATAVVLRLPASAVLGRCAVVLKGAPHRPSSMHFTVVGSYDPARPHVTDAPPPSRLWPLPGCDAAEAPAAANAAPGTETSGDDPSPEGDAASCDAGGEYGAPQASALPVVAPLAMMDVFSGCGGLSEGLHQGDDLRRNTPQAFSHFSWELTKGLKICVDIQPPLSNRQEAHPGNGPTTAFMGSYMGASTSATGWARPPLPPPVSTRLPQLSVRQPQGAAAAFSNQQAAGAGFWQSSAAEAVEPNYALAPGPIIAYLSYLDFYRPRFFLLENVPLFGRHSYFRRALRTLLELGYQARFGVLHAGHVGLPQSRKRLFLWGAAEGEPLPDWPAPLHALCPAGPGGAAVSVPGVPITPCDRVRYQTAPCPARAGRGAPLRPVTVRDAISDLPHVDNGVKQIRRAGAGKGADDDGASGSSSGSGSGSGSSSGGGGGGTGSSGDGDVGLPYLSEPVSALQRQMRAGPAGHQAGGEEAAAAAGPELVYAQVVRQLTPVQVARVKHIPPGGDWYDLLKAVEADPSLATTEQKDVVLPGAQRIRPNAKGLPDGPLLPETFSKRWEQHQKDPKAEAPTKGMYGRMRFDSIFPTAVTKPGAEQGTGWSIHPVEDRNLSVREFGRSQGLYRRDLNLAAPSGYTCWHAREAWFPGIPVGQMEGRTLDACFEVDGRRLRDPADGQVLRLELQLKERCVERGGQLKRDVLQFFLPTAVTQQCGRPLYVRGFTGHPANPPVVVVMTTAEATRLYPPPPATGTAALPRPSATGGPCSGSHAVRLADGGAWQAASRASRGGGRKKKRKCSPAGAAPMYRSRASVPAPYQRAWFPGVPVGQMEGRKLDACFEVDGQLLRDPVDGQVFRVEVELKERCVDVGGQLKRDMLQFIMPTTVTQQCGRPLYVRGFTGHPANPPVVVVMTTAEATRLPPPAAASAVMPPRPSPRRPSTATAPLPRALQAVPTDTEAVREALRDVLRMLQARLPAAEVLAAASGDSSGAGTGLSGAGGVSTREAVYAAALLLWAEELAADRMQAMRAAEGGVGAGGGGRGDGGGGNQAQPPVGSTSALLLQIAVLSVLYEAAGRSVQESGSLGPAAAMRSAAARQLLEELAWLAANMERGR